jgi:hypothetical protein
MDFHFFWTAYSDGIRELLKHKFTQLSAVDTICYRLDLITLYLSTADLSTNSLLNLGPKSS